MSMGKSALLRTKTDQGIIKLYHLVLKKDQCTQNTAFNPFTRKFTIFYLSPHCEFKETVVLECIKGAPIRIFGADHRLSITGTSIC